jgi:hypothetical protein
VIQSLIIGCDPSRRIKSIPVNQLRTKWFDIFSNLQYVLRTIAPKIISCYSLLKYLIDAAIILVFIPTKDAPCSVMHFVRQAQQVGLVDKIHCVGNGTYCGYPSYSHLPIDCCIHSHFSFVSHGSTFQGSLQSTCSVIIAFD